MTYNGIDAMQRGQIEQAQSLFIQAVAADPDDPRIRAELARTLARNDQLSQAIDEMSKAVELSGGEASYHIELGELYMRFGRLELARENADRALHNNRRLAGAWALRGKIEKAMGQLDQARVSLHRALVHDESQDEIRFLLAQTYFELRQPDRSLAILQALCQRHGIAEVPDRYLLLNAQALAAIDQLDPAAELLAKVADRPEPLPEVLLELGRIQMLRGDVANARRTLTRGRDLFADRSEFQAQLDQLLSLESRTAGIGGS
jgi:Flp pilus assembly protein TadD